MVKFSLLTAIAIFVAPALALLFNIDCTNCPSSCNNDCYAVYVADKGAGAPLYYDKLGSTRRRKASGCTMSKNGKSVCGDTGNAHYRKTGDTCDEFPYASVEQGGAGAILRCVPRADNVDEGTQLQAFYKRKKDGCDGKTCTFGLTITKYQNSPFCTGTKVNDGYEFVLKDGKYVNAKIRRGNEADDFYASQSPNATNFFPPELRREFLASNGETVLFLSRDMEANLIGEVIGYNDANGTSVMIVRELFGNEKSPPFQPAKL